MPRRKVATKRPEKPHFTKYYKRADHGIHVSAVTSFIRGERSMPLYYQFQISINFSYQCRIRMQLTNTQRGSYEACSTAERVRLSQNIDHRWGCQISIGAQHQSCVRSDHSLEQIINLYLSTYKNNFNIVKVQ